MSELEYRALHQGQASSRQAPSDRHDEHRGAHPAMAAMNESARVQQLQQAGSALSNRSIPFSVNRTGLPDALKAGAESLSGLSLDHVRVHYNSPRPAQLRAHAYAQGNDIHLAPGQERHLPHETWHVVQQATRKVPVTDRTLCQQVEALVGELEYLRVFVANSYPLVMVRFDLSAFMSRYSQRPVKGSAIKGYTSFLMNYFMGMVNFYANNDGLVVKMVKRSSFGFLTPSIAETGESFRINPGLMPLAYATVIARALQQLDKELTAISQKKVPMSSMPLDPNRSMMPDSFK